MRELENIERHILQNIPDGTLSNAEAGLLCKMVSNLDEVEDASHMLMTFNREPDRRDLPAIPDSVVHQVIENLNYKRVGEHF
jgi:hypothetical protein